MLKKIIFLILLVFSPYKAWGIGSSQYLNNQAPSLLVSAATFDNLVMDFTIKQNQEKEKFNALTFSNRGDAQDLFHIRKIKVWSDQGKIGWQGMGVDKYLGQALWYANKSYWYLSGLEEDIPKDGLRIFVSLETPASPAKNTYTEMQIPLLSDQGKKGSFDLSDQGIFTSFSTGPDDASLINTYQQTLYKNIGDMLGPKSVITNLADQSILNGTSYILKGLVRDQGGSSPQWIKVGINDLWYLAEITGKNSEEEYIWQYTWNNIADGSYVIKTKSADWLNKEEPLTEGINVTFKNQKEAIKVFNDNILVKETSSLVVYLMENNKKRSIPSEAIFLSWGYKWSDIKTEDLSGIETGENLRFRDGYLIKGSDSKVYVVSDNGQKRWIASENIFLGMGYKWDKVNIVSDAQLISYPSGLDITYSLSHPHGSLVKYPGNSSVYLIEDNKKRAFLNELSFLSRGYYWENIIVIPHTEIYSEGLSLN